MSILLTNVYEALRNTDNNKIGCAVCMEIQPNAFDFDCNNFTFTFEQCERWKYRLTENKRREKKKLICDGNHLSCYIYSRPKAIRLL